MYLYIYIIYIIYVLTFLCVRNTRFLIVTRDTSRNDDCLISLTNRFLSIFLLFVFLLLLPRAATRFFSRCRRARDAHRELTINFILRISPSRKRDAAAFKNNRNVNEPSLRNLPYKIHFYLPN